MCGAGYVVGGCGWRSKMESKYQLRNPGTKRLMREAAELSEPTEQYSARPLEDNLFEWHFTVRGPPNTEFEEGVYHGRILLPAQYPMRPPDIILLTPNGRFEINKKICLSISGHHPECWQPSWSIRTALLAIIAFMPNRSLGAIGSLDYPPEERQALARKSQLWECPVCGRATDLLLPKKQASFANKLDEINRVSQQDEKLLHDIYEPSNFDDDSVDADDDYDEPILDVESERDFENQISAILTYVIMFSIVVLLFRRFCFTPKTVPE